VDMSGDYRRSGFYACPQEIKTWKVRPSASSISWIVQMFEIRCGGGSCAVLMKANATER
jgi:hypothetical protein